MTQLGQQDLGTLPQQVTNAASLQLIGKGFQLVFRPSGHLVNW